MMPDRVKVARELLAFFSEAGVDSVVGETPNDFLTKTKSPTPESMGSIAQRSSGGQQDGPSDRARRSDPPLLREGITAPLAPDAAVMAAREAARSAASLDELRASLEKFDACALKSTATQLVFADGNPKGRIMLVGEAPGYEEDKQGLPFVGRSGKLLDLILAAIGLDRSKVYIANIVPWRPPGNRTPTPAETQICLPFIQRQIELCDPDVLVTIGQPSTAALLQVQGIMK